MVEESLDSISGMSVEKCQNLSAFSHGTSAAIFDRTEPHLRKRFRAKRVDVMIMERLFDACSNGKNLINKQPSAELISSSERQ
jgi:hypothetical protein